MDGGPFYCGENEIQASLISSASVGATPTPATNLREVIRLPDCKSGVIKYVSEATSWSVTSTSHQPSPPAAGGKGCRAEARSAETGFIFNRATARQDISNS